jgi:hypothetical protein
MSEITACSQSAAAFTLCCHHHQQEEVPYEGCVCTRLGASDPVTDLWRDVHAGCRPAVRILDGLPSAA